MLRRYISGNPDLDNSFASKFSGRQFQCLYLYRLLGATSEQVAEMMGCLLRVLKNMPNGVRLF